MFALPLPFLQQLPLQCLFQAAQDTHSDKSHTQDQFERGSVLQVLKPCSGKAVPGQVVAFLGPSGAGKSTLLDILADRKSSGKLQGQVSPLATLVLRLTNKFSECCYHPSACNPCTLALDFHNLQK